MNLLVKLKLSGETRYRVHGAARIKVAADGILTIVNVAGETAETIRMADVESILIHPVVATKAA